MLLQNLLIKWKQTFINIYQAPASKFPRSNFYSEASLSSLILSHSQGQLAHCYWVLLPQLAEFLPVLWQESQISLHSIEHCLTPLKDPPSKFGYYNLRSTNKIAKMESPAKLLISHNSNTKHVVLKEEIWVYWDLWNHTLAMLGNKDPGIFARTIFYRTLGSFSNII